MATSYPFPSQGPRVSRAHPPLQAFLLLLGALVACQVDGGREAPQEGRAVATLELESSFPGPFGYLSGVREMEDGRVLAADPMSQVLLLLDMETGKADTLGREGEGPQEYRGPDEVFPLPGGETLLVDLGNGRLSVLDSGGTFIRWYSMYRNDEEGRPRGLLPRFVDARGGIFASGIQGAATAPPDSTPISRFELEGGAEEIVAWAWHPDWGPLFQNPKRPMLIPADDWAVGEDGRVALVRANGYGVDWFFPDGRRVNGPVYEEEGFPVGEAEKEAEVEAMMAGAVVTQTLVGSDGSTTSQQMSRGVPEGNRSGMDEFSWPDLLPVFRAGGTLVSPQGEVWVERRMPEDRLPRMDVFGEDGVRRGYVELPRRTQLLGFGSGPDGTPFAYLVRTDEVGLKWLERHRVAPLSN